MENIKTTQNIGEFLRAERERRNITVEQVASATKVSLKLLHSLESDDFSALPAKPFVRGFVMAYAKYIGLNPQEIVTRFEGELTEQSSKKFIRADREPHIFVEKESAVDNSKTVLSIIMGVFVVAAIVIFAFVKPSLRHKRSKKAAEPVALENSEVSNATLVTVAPPPSTTNSTSTNSTVLSTIAAVTAPAVVATATPTPAPTPTATPKPTVTPTPTATPKPTASAAPSATPAGATAIPYSQVKQLLVVRALEDSWIKYQADDFPVRQYTLKKGQKIYVRGRESIRFRCYKAEGVELSYDGSNFKPLTDNSRTLIMPAAQEERYRTEPFKE